MAADRELAAARPDPRCTGGQLQATARDHHPIMDPTTRRVLKRTASPGVTFNMPIPSVCLIATVQTTLPKIFDQAQSSIANHQKNCVALYKLHLKASEIRQSPSSGNGEKLVGERIFEEAICDMMSRVLLVKKGQAVADRIAKFLAAYIKVLVEKSVSSLDQHLYTNRLIAPTGSR